MLKFHDASKELPTKAGLYLCVTEWDDTFELLKFVPSDAVNDMPNYWANPANEDFTYTTEEAQREFVDGFVLYWCDFLKEVPAELK